MDVNLRQFKAVPQSPTGSDDVKVQIADPKTDQRKSSQWDGQGVVSFHDINYVVEEKLSPCAKATSKQVLKNISGIFKPGMNAILGPTGSGKSSLLDVLAGRKDPQFLKGTMLIDGRRPPENFKCIFGYVVQDDVMMCTLTVRENIEFSARLRLPNSVSDAERKEKVDQVIYELGLTHVADSKIGNEIIRGVSGGERKRCSIGMELVTSPAVLFLDEPTTGLDASTANAVMLLLKRLSERGCNIIFSIHQPRFSIFRLFDHLILLSRGDVMYHGPASDALDFFTSIGYVCEEHNNPPDFFLDVINGDSTAVNNQTNGSGIHQSGADRAALIERQNSAAKGPSDLNEKYLESTWHKRCQGEMQPLLENFKRTSKSKSTTINYHTGFKAQLAIVCRRQLRHISRNPITTVMQVIIGIVLSVIVDLVFHDLTHSPISAIQNRSGAFFFMLMNQVFSNMPAVELFLKDRAVFVHENVSGFYRVSAYFTAKVTCDLIPIRIVPVAIFCCLTYFALGLRGGVDHFFIYTLILFMTVMAASSLCFLVSSSQAVFAKAYILLALCYVPMMLFSGLLFNMRDMGAWLSWLEYISIFRYSLNTLYINELKDVEFCDVVNGTTECVYGNLFLARNSIDYETTWDLWKNMFALGVMAVVFQILAYVQLRRIKKWK